MRFVYEMVARALDRIASGDSAVFDTVGRTLSLAVLATAVALLIGLPLGVVLAERSTRWRRLGFVLANAGLGLPPVVLGVFLALLLLPGSLLGGLDWINTLRGVWLAQLLLALPIVVALTAAAVAALPPGLLSQAAAFGASWPSRAALALREARIGVLAAVITALGSAVAEVGAVVIVGGNITGHTETVASAVLSDLSAADPVGATAQVIVLLAIVALLGIALTVVQQAAPRKVAAR